MHLTIRLERYSLIQISTAAQPYRHYRSSYTLPIYASTSTCSGILRRHYKKGSKQIVLLAELSHGHLCL